MSSIGHQKLIKNLPSISALFAWLLLYIIRKRSRIPWVQLFSARSHLDKYEEQAPAPVAGGWAGAVMSWAGAEMIWAGA